MKLTKEQKRIIDLYNLNRIAFIYPRLNKISLNGGAREPFKEGFKKIVECLKKEGILK